VSSFGRAGGATYEPERETQRSGDRWQEAAKRREARTAESDAELVDDADRS
jgi:hypothetical protein